METNKREINFGFSPCPNDTFAYHALAQGLVGGEEFEIIPFMADVEDLNRRALTAQLELSKLSFHALAHVLEDYWLLTSGAALGRGCGPLVVSLPENRTKDLSLNQVAVPGALTTAHLLLSLYLGKPPRVKAMEFSQVMPAVARGECPAGVIIHEGRFTYSQYGLVEVLDLGAWWETTSGLPLPLGCVVARRNLGRRVARRLQELLRDSVNAAMADPAASRDFVLENAQEMDQEVVDSHIGLYVNEYTQNLGDTGLAAVRRMLRMGRRSGLLPDGPEEITL
jgi:1,4-dihydroxy-6-naphthoate synthase